MDEHGGTSRQAPGQQPSHLDLGTTAPGCYRSPRTAACATGTDSRGRALLGNSRRRRTAGSTTPLLAGSLVIACLNTVRSGQLLLPPGRPQHTTAGTWAYGIGAGSVPHRRVLTLLAAAFGKPADRRRKPRARQANLCRSRRRRAVTSTHRLANRRDAVTITHLGRLRKFLDTIEIAGKNDASNRDRALPQGAAEGGDDHRQRSPTTSPQHRVPTDANLQAASESILTRFIGTTGSPARRSGLTAGSGPTPRTDRRAAGASSTMRWGDA
jgi:hypothetical protein